MTREVFLVYPWNLNLEQAVSRSRANSSRRINFFLILWIVAYGWGSEVAGFLVEKVSGQTLEQFWYVILYYSCKISFYARHDWS